MLMLRKATQYITLSLLVSIPALLNAQRYLGPPRSGKKVNPSLVAQCSPATATQELNIGNTRAIIQAGGDMWWDLIGRNLYEIPKNSGRMALFNGALWLGGQDVSGQLKVAAQRYRSNGNDYWTGPLSTVTSEILPETCAEWDKHFLSYRRDIDEFNAWFEAGLNDAENGTNTQAELFPNYSVPDIIVNWPAHGRPEDPYNEDFYLAPFYDRNGDGVYNAADGDYPGYDLNGTQDCSQRIVGIYGDQNLWWIFNDKGNIHTESGSAAIGMEIRAQAFAFATNDEVNDMTFLNYELVNRSTFTLTETYFGNWIDVALGDPFDDYVGCDVMRGLGYAYNGDEFDGDNQGYRGYGAQPPAIGVDFFQGPFQDNDGIDNAYGTGEGEALNGVGYGDGIPDNERFGMRRFLYHINSTGPTGDPQTGAQYYNFLRGIWNDGTKMIYGGTGHIGDPEADKNTPADFMFPGDTDTLGWGTNGKIMPEWTEQTAGNTPFDRRFLQSAGPFTLEPGAVNNITTGIVWAQASAGGAFASVEKMRKADDKTQALFDNCFKVLNGPDAPDVEIQELDQQLVLFIKNRPTSNNFGEQYSEVDPFIIAPAGLTEEERIAYTSYKFQGYLVYQLKDGSVPSSDLNNPDLARLVAQCDIRDGVSKIVNYYFDEQLGGNIPRIEVDGSNNGIQHSFLISEDQFATGTKSLVNHKTYYFMVLAYAYNNYQEYDPLDPDKLVGQTKPFMASRKSVSGGIIVDKGIPHKTNVESNGVIVNSSYGDLIPLTRVEGTGNGGNFLRLTNESMQAAFNNNGSITKNLEYTANGSPVKVKIVDPLNVPSGNYTLRFTTTDSSFNYSTWNYQIEGDNLVEPLYSTNAITQKTEQLFLDLGLSVELEQVHEPGFNIAPNNGFIGAEIEYENPQDAWLSGIPDADDFSAFNWIRSGKSTDDNNPDFNDYSIGSSVWLDEFEVYEDILGGTVAPFRLSAFADHAPMNKNFAINDVYRLIGIDSTIYHLNSVDIILTPNKELWSRVPVLELQDTVGLAEGGAVKNMLRAAPSVNKDGVAAEAGMGPSDNPNDPNYISETGMGWFPGYAIDVETGARLNMAFGEDSWLQNENGNDMLWNPTTTITEGPWGDIRFGGKHYIYVFRNMLSEENVPYVPVTLQYFEDPKNRMPNYDAGAFIKNQLALGGPENIRNVYRACSWVALPTLIPGKELLATPCTLRLRVNAPFKKLGTETPISAGEALEVGKTYVVNSGPIEHNGITYKRGDAFTAVSSSFSVTTTDSRNVLSATENAGLPLYNFSLNPFATEKAQLDVAQNALSDIKVVPNPYYAYSAYETSKVDNRIKIINLPELCTVTIYTTNGDLVKQIRKDNTNTFVEWNLTNNQAIPISSGTYIIHVDAPGIGEAVVKFFGILRPVDLDSF